MIDYEKLYANAQVTSSPTRVCLECEATADAFVNKCKACGGAIDVLYALEKVEWRGCDASPNPMRRYRELLPVDDEEDLVWLGEGNTPCISVKPLAELLGVRSVHLKDESRNPTRSTKDRIASATLSRFKGLGVREFVMASTGNSSTAYANAMSLVNDFRLHIFVGEQFAYRLNYADHPRITTHSVTDTFVGAGTVAQRFAKENGYFWEGGFFNYARREGLKLAYLEAYQQMPVAPTHVFQAISSGMGLVGGYKGAVEAHLTGALENVPAFVGVQEEICSPMVSAWDAGRSEIVPDDIVEFPNGLAHAIQRGDPTNTYPYLHGMCENTGGALVAARSADMHMARGLLRSLGFEACYAASACLAGAMRMAQEGTLDADSDVLIILTGADRPTLPIPTNIRSH